MKEFLQNFSKGSVLVCGDVMLDSYYFGDTDRISPEGPVPVVNIRKSESRVGGAGNVALNISSLSGKASLLGYTGEDEASQQIEDLLKEKSIRSHLIRSADSPTITKLRVISQNQQLIRLDWETRTPELDYEALSKSFDQYIASSNVVVLSDYAKGTLVEPERLIQSALKANKPVLVDPKGTDFKRYRGATLLTPNLKEFEAVAGKCSSEYDLIQKAVELIKSLEIDSLLITRSEKGMTLIDRNGISHNYPTQAKQVYDVTGAGDTVIATIALALASNAPLTAAVHLANIAAGIVVGKVGTATATPDELSDAVRLSVDRTSQDLLEQSDLKPILKQCRETGLTIVFTNGCFDVLHPGHVAYLEEAKALGDRLVVALNDDASVGRIKGPERPINNLEFRAKVIRGLRSVDYVTYFSEDTPEQIIKELLPDILVKGGDYEIHEIVGAETIKNNGGKVITLSFIEGCSTTRILNKIKQGGTDSS